MATTRFNIFSLHKASTPPKIDKRVPKHNLDRCKCIYFKNNLYLCPLVRNNKRISNRWK